MSGCRIPYKMARHCLPVPVSRFALYACAPFLLSLIVLGCKPSPDTEGDGVIATVGDRTISVDEFRVNYELGFPHLKTGSNPRRVYLDRMIDEKLLALEGYRLRLHERSQVREKVLNLHEELLVGQVFNEMVDNQIRVSDEEIEDLRYRDHVSFRLRFLPTTTWIQARRMRDLIVDSGFERAFAEWESGDVDKRLKSSDFETGFVLWSDVEPDLLKEIVDLPVGTVSEPIQYRGSFIVVQVVDIRRTPLTDSPRAAEKDHYLQILQQQKAKIRARQFVKETMSSSELRIRTGPYRYLEKYLWSWIQTHERIDNLFESLERSGDGDTDSLRAVYGDTLLATRDEQWTVAQFLKDFPYRRYPFSRRSFRAFQTDLYDGFGLLLRDRAFLEIARSRGYGELPSIRKELGLWSDKWVYRELVRAIGDTVSVTPEDVEAYFAKQREFWPQDADLGDVRSDVEEMVHRARTDAIVLRFVETLRKRYRIVIDAEALARVDLYETAGSSKQTITVVKGSSGRPAWPVVDPAR
jgi:hypothetical protein